MDKTKNTSILQYEIIKFSNCMIEFFNDNYLYKNSFCMNEGTTKIEFNKIRLN